jgi:hypothetical protein
VTRCLPDELDLVHEYTRVYQSATRCISDRSQTVWLLERYTDSVDMPKQIRVETPTATDQGRPLQTGRDLSADRGRSVHDRVIEFDRGT